MTKFLAFSSAILLGLITVFGDYLIKKGSLKISFSGWQYLLAGCIIYGLTGVGWFFVFRRIEISDVGRHIFNDLHCGASHARRYSFSREIKSGRDFRYCFCDSFRYSAL